LGVEEGIRVNHRLYAFVLHMIETLKPKTGRMGVVVPHGVLFRGAAEGKIRKKLIDENLLDAVIGLPEKLFYGTGIPAAILIMRRNKTDRKVLFVDASREYEQIGDPRLPTASWTAWFITPTAWNSSSGDLPCRPKVSDTMGAMPKTLPSTAVEIIEIVNQKLGIIPTYVAGRPSKVPLDDDCVIALGAIVRTVKEIPDELLQVTATERAGLYVALEELEYSIQLRRSQDTRSRMQNPIPEMQPMLWLDKLQPDKSNRYSTEVIRDVLQQCPDEAVRPGTNELSFITDQALRETLRTDISTMNSALSNGEYKAATVLGGSVIEALLLWGLSKKTPAEQQAAEHGDHGLEHAIEGVPNLLIAARYFIRQRHHWA
jgi:hypothetical protein